MAASGAIILLTILVVVVAVLIYVAYKKRGTNNNNDDDDDDGTQPAPKIYPIDDRPKLPLKDPADGIKPGDALPAVRVVGFVENWACYRRAPYTVDTSTMDLTQCDWAFLSFAAPGPDGTVLSSDIWADLNKNQLDGFIQNCKKSGCVPGLAIGGYSYSLDTTDATHKFSSSFDEDKPVYITTTMAENMDNLLQNATVQATFAKSVVDLCLKKGFELVNFDFEYPNCPGNVCDPERWNQKQAFVNFCQFMASTLKEANIIFSIDISPNRYTLAKGTDLAKLNTIENLNIFIMSYDYIVFEPGNNTASTGHNQALTPGNNAYKSFNMTETLEYIASQPNFKPEKYALGAASYGRCFPLSSEAFTAAVQTENYNFLQYANELPDHYKFPASQQPGVIFQSELYNKELPGNITYVPGDGAWLAASDGVGVCAVTVPRTVAAIRALMAKYKIPNVILWTLTQDTGTDGKPILQPMFKRTDAGVSGSAGMLETGLPDIAPAIAPADMAAGPSTSADSDATTSANIKSGVTTRKRKKLNGPSEEKRKKTVVLPEEVENNLATMMDNQKTFSRPSSLLN